MVVEWLQNDHPQNHTPCSVSLQLLPGGGGSSFFHPWIWAWYAHFFGPIQFRGSYSLPGLRLKKTHVLFSLFWNPALPWEQVLALPWRMRGHEKSDKSPQPRSPVCQRVRQQSINYLTDQQLTKMNEGAPLSPAQIGKTTSWLEDPWELINGWCFMSLSIEGFCYAAIANQII